MPNKSDDTQSVDTQPVDTQPDTQPVGSEPDETKPVDTQIDTKPKKNPKRVEAGKKGAAARWAKKQEQTKQVITKVTRDDELVTKEPPIKRNYENYIPWCIALVGIGGVGLYICKNKFKQSSESASDAPTSDDTRSVPVTSTVDHDIFDL